MDLQTTSRPVRRPRFRRAEAPPAFQLTERDVEIIRLVARHRFLRSTHISQLLDAAHKKVLERLSPLFHAGFLDRPRAQLEYHVYGEHRNPPIVYALGNRGAKLLQENGSVASASSDWATKNLHAGRQFLMHALAVADVHTALVVACRRRPGISLQQAEDLLATLSDAVRIERNPWSWRTQVRHDGASVETAVLPDYVFALVFPDQTRRAFLVECDRGTMPIERTSLAQTSMLRKFLGYAAGRQQRIHTARFGWKTFRVLVITASVERADNMRALIQRTSQLKNSPLFFFAEHASLARGDALAHPWLDAHGATHTLIEGICV